MFKICQQNVLSATIVQVFNGLEKTLAYQQWLTPWWKKILRLPYPITIQKISNWKNSRRKPTLKLFGMAKMKSLLSISCLQRMSKFRLDNSSKVLKDSKLIYTWSISNLFIATFVLLRICIILLKTNKTSMFYSSKNKPVFKCLNQ